MTKISNSFHRNAFGEDEEKALLECISYYRKKNQDPPYDGFFQKKYEKAFSNKIGDGFTIAVNTGSSACYLAILSLELPKGSTILNSESTTSK